MRRSSLSAKLLLGMIGSATILLALEAILRLDMRPPVFVPDSRYLFRLATSGAWARKRATINQAGYRGAEIARPKPAGRFRILALGGSTTFGHGLRDEETWPVRLQGLLVERGFDCEVINGGVPGWGIGHCLLRLADDAAWLEPDLVLVYTGWNHPAIDPQRSFNPFPYGATLVRSWPHWLLESGLFLWLGKHVAKLTGEANATTGVGVDRYDLDVHLPLLESGIHELAGWARSHGIPVAMIRYPALVGAASDPGDLDLYRTVLLRDNPRGEAAPLASFQMAKEGYLRTVDLIARVASEEGLWLLDAASPFDQLPAKERVEAFLDRMHPSVTGAKVIAACLASQLAERLPGLGLAPNPPPR